MKTFHDFYYSMPVKEREGFCQKVGTTVNYAERLAGGWRLPSLRMAKRLIEAARGELSFHSLIATWEQRNGPL